jgi:hypothetical protein
LDCDRGRLGVRLLFGLDDFRRAQPVIDGAAIGASFVDPKLVGEFADAFFVVHDVLLNRKTWNAEP